MACAGGLALALGAGSAMADEVSVEVRDRVEEALSGTFMQPQTAIWRFDSDKPYVSGKRIVCGAVNFQSAQQMYVGYYQFYAIVTDGKVLVAQIADPVSDVSGKLAETLRQFCGKP